MQTSHLKVEEIFFLDDPPGFKLTVDKQKVDARLISTRFVEGLGYLLKIEFSDDHEDEYELDALQVHTAEGYRDAYCRALEKEIYNPLWSWTPAKKVYVINFPVNNTDTNIWIVGNVHANSKQEYFVVYHLNEFQFQIKKENGQWQTTVHEAYEYRKIDTDLLNKVISVLNYYIA